MNSTACMGSGDEMFCFAANEMTVEQLVDNTYKTQQSQSTALTTTATEKTCASCGWGTTSAKCERCGAAMTPEEALMR